MQNGWLHNLVINAVFAFIIILFQVNLVVLALLVSAVCA